MKYEERREEGGPAAAHCRGVRTEFEIKGGAKSKIVATGAPRAASMESTSDPRGGEDSRIRFLYRLQFTVMLQYYSGENRLHSLCVT